MFRGGMLSFALMQMVLRCCDIDVETMKVCRCWYLTVSRYWTSSFELLGLGYMSAKKFRAIASRSCEISLNRVVMYRGHSIEFPKILPGSNGLDTTKLRKSIDLITEVACTKVVRRMINDNNYHLVLKMLSLADSTNDVLCELWHVWQHEIVKRANYNNQEASLYIRDCFSILLRREMSWDMYYDQDNCVTILMELCKCNAKKSIRVLLSYPVSIDKKCRRGITALMYSHGHVDIVEMILEKNPDVRATDKYGNTAFMLACKNGFENSALVLFRAGVDVETVNQDGDTALMLASSAGLFGCVSTLLENGAKVDVQNRKGNTALLCASRMGYIESESKLWPKQKKCMSLLLNAGASTQLADIDGNTALMHVILQRDGGKARLLLKFDADVNVQNDDGDTALMVSCKYMRPYSKQNRALLLESGADVDIQNFKGKSALMLASKNSDHACVKELLKAKASPNLEDRNERTALMLASKVSANICVNYLIEYGAVLDAVDDDGMTAMMFAAKNRVVGKHTALYTLLRSGADVNIQDNNDLNALMKAVIGKNVLGVYMIMAAISKDRSFLDSVVDMLSFTSVNDEYISMCARVLYTSGADINATDWMGRTALILASDFSCQHMQRCVAVLVRAGADVELNDGTGKTALMYVIKRGNMWGVKAILEVMADKSLDVDAADDDGNTALMIAVDCGRENFIQLLLDAGANANAINDAGHKFISSVM